MRTRCLLCGYTEAQHDWIKDHKFVPCKGIERIFDASTLVNGEEESFTVPGFVSPPKEDSQCGKQLLLNLRYLAGPTPYL